MRVGDEFNPAFAKCSFYPHDFVDRDRTLSDGAKRVYARLVRFAGKDGHCWPSQATLSYELGKSDRQVRRDLAEIKVAGLIRPQAGRRKSSTYIFLWSNLFEPIHLSTQAEPLTEHKCPPKVDDLEIFDRTHTVARPDTYGRKTGHMCPTTSSSIPKELEKKEELQKKDPPLERTKLANPKNGISLVFDDDHAGPPRERLPDPKEEMRLRLRERHGANFDIEFTLALISKELDGQCLDFEEFLTEDDTRTTNPRKLTNPTGHYRRLATDLARLAPLRRHREQAATAREAKSPKAEKKPEVIIEPTPLSEKCPNCRCRKNGSGVVLIDQPDGRRNAAPCPVCSPPPGAPETSNGLRAQRGGRIAGSL